MSHPFADAGPGSDPTASQAPTSSSFAQYAGTPTAPTANMSGSVFGPPQQPAPLPQGHNHHKFPLPGVCEGRILERKNKEYIGDIMYTNSSSGVKQTGAMLEVNP
jgi:hypothetical protein